MFIGPFDSIYNDFPKFTVFIPFWDPKYRKCILSVKSDFSELRQVGKLKLSTNDDVNIALKCRKQGFSDIRHFYPFLGPETLQFVTENENAHCLTTAIFRNQ